MSFFTEVIANEGGSSNVSSSRHTFKGRNRAALRNLKSALERVLAIDQRIAAKAGSDADTATYMLATSGQRAASTTLINRISAALAL